MIQGPAVIHCITVVNSKQTDKPNGLHPNSPFIPANQNLTLGSRENVIFNSHKLVYLRLERHETVGKMPVVALTVISVLLKGPQAPQGRRRSP